jgi:hypothetical protein
MHVISLATKFERCCATKVKWNRNGRGKYVTVWETGDLNK